MNSPGYTHSHFFYYTPSSPTLSSLLKNQEASVEFSGLPKQVTLWDLMKFQLQKYFLNIIYNIFKHDQDTDPILKEMRILEKHRNQEESK